MAETFQAKLKATVDGLAGLDYQCTVGIEVGDEFQISIGVVKIFDETRKTAQAFHSLRRPSLDEALDEIRKQVHAFIHNEIAARQRAVVHAGDALAKFRSG